MYSVGQKYTPGYIKGFRPVRKKSEKNFFHQNEILLQTVTITLT